MIINNKAIDLLRASAHECEKAIGTEYADVYTAKHVATLETILELAEDSSVIQASINAVPVVQEQVNLNEDVEEMDDEPAPRRKTHGRRP